MGFDAKQIPPADLQPSVGVGVDLPYTGDAVFNTTYTTKAALKANLINYFLTNKGERYLNPSFGSNLRSLLFENINKDSLDDIKEIIAEDLKNYFPQVSPSNLEVTGEPDRNAVRFYMSYKIIESNIEDTLLINIAD